MHSSREKLIAVAVTLAMIMILCVTCMGAGGPADEDWLGSGGAEPTNTGDIYHMGNVGIGTTSSEAKLDVKDAGAEYILLDLPPVGYFGTDAANKVALVGDASPGSSLVVPEGSNIGVLGLALGGTDNWAVWSAGNLYASGNVLIGVGTLPEIPEEKLHVVGNIRVEGHIFKDGGTCYFIEEHPQDSTKEIVYACLEGPEAGTYIRGTAQLVNGEAVVNLPEHFSLVTSDEGLTVQLTPVGEWLQLYVVEKGTEQIVVREANGKNGEFDYLVQGVRKGYEDYQVIRDNE